MDPPSSPRRVRFRAARCLAAALLLLGATPARAQSSPASPAAQEAARTKGEQGLAAFEKEQWQEAYDRFREADALFHAPTLVLFMARCKAKLGKLLEARDLYEKLINEPVPKAAAPAFRDAVKAGRNELEVVRPRIPSVEIAVTGVAPGAARVTIDRSPVSVAELGTKKELDPGAHTIEASADGAQSLTRSVTLAEGATVRVDLPFPPQAGSAPPPLPGSTATPDAQPAADASPRRGSILPGVIGLGIGAIGLGVGAVTGIITLGKAGDITSRCEDSHCLEADEADADSARTMGTVSTIAFIVGGVGVAAGGVLLVLRPFGGDSRPDAGVAWRAGIGPGRVAIGGAF